MSKVIGIDLGTTNSCVAVVEAGDPTVIINSDGGRTTPSVVGFSKTGERLVGSPAKRQAVLNPERTVASIKRKMGTRDATTIDGKDYSPEQISASILQKLKADAEAYLGEPVTQAVITVPAYFDDTQRKATKDAGEIAGLEVLRIINEPTAAALAYGHSEQKKEATILVYDLGGGTFDVSILDVEIDKSTSGADDKEKLDYYEVLATSGDTHLGGDDFDQRLVDFIADEFKKENGVDLRKDRQALQRLREAAEKAKCELSTTLQTTVSLPFITSVEGEGPKHLEMTVTRAKLEELISDLIDKTAVSVKRAMEDAKLTKDKIDEVILVGGSTRIPKVQELVKELTGKDPDKGINPDEVVAVGASIQAAILASGGAQGMVLIDVTPLTLGIETLGDVMDVLIGRNTAVPTKVNRIYSTASDFQTTVEVHVLQGERPRASQNKSLGKFHLAGIPPKPRGMPQIEVTFDLDANGILSVSATDKETGKQQQITITGSGALSKDEIENMVQQAEGHAAEDAKFKELAEARNQAESVAYQLERTLNELGENMPEAEKAAVKAKVEALREVAKGEDAAEIRAAVEAANAEFQEASKRAYEASAAAQQAQGGPGQEPGAEAPPKHDDDVIDADFTAEDDKK